MQLRWKAASIVTTGNHCDKERSCLGTLESQRTQEHTEARPALHGWLKVAHGRQMKWQRCGAMGGGGKLIMCSSLLEVSRYTVFWDIAPAPSCIKWHIAYAAALHKLLCMLGAHPKQDKMPERACLQRQLLPAVCHKLNDHDFSIHGSLYLGQKCNGPCKI